MNLLPLATIPQKNASSVSSTVAQLFEVMDIIISYSTVMGSKIRPTQHTTSWPYQIKVNSKHTGHNKEQRIIKAWNASCKISGNKDTVRIPWYS